MDPVIKELIEEMRREMPPVEDSIALYPWRCKHNVLFDDWYAKEVICGLEH